MKFNFYFSFDESVKEEVFRRYLPKAKAPKKDVFVIFRSDDLLDKFDDSSMVLYFNFES